MLLTARFCPRFPTGACLGTRAAIARFFVGTFFCRRALQAGDVDEEDEGSDVSGSDTPSELLDDDDMYDDDEVSKTSSGWYLMLVDGDSLYPKKTRKFVSATFPFFATKALTV